MNLTSLFGKNNYSRNRNKESTIYKYSTNQSRNIKRNNFTRNRNNMTGNSLNSFLNSFDTPKVKDNKTTDASTIDNYKGFRKVSKIINLKKTNNKNLSINNKKYNNPIKPKHNLILNDDYSNHNNTLNKINNNNNTITYNSIENSHFSISPYNSTIDRNNNNSLVENNNINDNINNFFLRRHNSRIKLEREVSKSDYNVPNVRKIKKRKTHTNTNLLNVINLDKDNNISLNKYEFKLLSAQKAKKLHDNTDESNESKFNSINSKSSSMLSDNNDNGGFFLKKKAKAKKEFNLHFIRKKNKKKLSIEKGINNNEISNNYTLIRNEFNLSNLTHNNNRSRNIFKKNNYFTISSDENMDNYSNNLIRKTNSVKPGTQILRYQGRQSNSQSENDDTFPKNIKSMKYNITDSDSNYKSGKKENFISKLKSWHKNKYSQNNEKYTKSFIFGALKKTNDDHSPNIFIKKEQNPYQINQLKNNLLNNNYLSNFNNNNFIINNSSSDEEENYDNNNYRKKRISYIDNISQEQAISLISQDNNKSYMTLSKDSVIFIDEPENIKTKKTNKRFMKQLSRIPEFKERRNNGNSLFGSFKIQSAKIKKNINLKDNEKKNFLNKSLPLPKINNLQIKFKKKKKSIKYSDEDLMDNPSLDSNESNSYSYFKSNSKKSFFDLRSNSVKFSMAEFKFQKNNHFIIERAKKLIKFLSKDKELKNNINYIDFNRSYLKEEFMKYITEYNSQKLEKIETEINEFIYKKEIETLTFKKHLFTNKIISIKTKGKIMNQFLKKILIPEKRKLCKIMLPSYIKYPLLENYFNINIYEKIMTTTYLLKDISEEEKEITIIKNFTQIEKSKKKKTYKFQSINQNLPIVFCLSSKKLINKFMIFDNLEESSSNVDIEKPIIITKKISFFDIKNFQKFQTKKSLNFYSKRAMSRSSNKTFTLNRDKRKKTTRQENGILKKKFFSRRRNELLNEQIFKFHQKKQKQKITYLRRRGEVLFQSPLKIKRNQKNENLIEQSVIRRVFNRESMMYETHKIKNELIKEANTFIDILFLYIKDGNYQNFEDMFKKFNPGIEERDDKGNTFLNLSVQCCCKPIIKFLLHKGANSNSQNKKLNTPLHYALSFQNYDIADLLLKYGADESIKNVDGLTPWQCVKSTNTIY